ncbi:TULIP family P47-like protein [Altererythrobacter salegens]|uniref:TULIP family P47-like protein n=1 Tax=Croceibacterium salegens TaxID=1737568 RepID=A0A6I4SZK0_9SPHN|nr:TULIP family P47-like protein [Croceibacterium salegens]MXO61293.1 TULIP family P47-like protein [Croceibacterium salegens]
MGWHTVAAVRYADVNRAITAEGTAPSSFEQSASDGSASTVGTFGSWRLTTGGAGKNLKLEIEVTGGSVSVVGQNPETRNISDCAFDVSVEADFIPQLANASVRELRLSGGQAVEVGDSTPKNPTGAFLHTAALKQLLQDWLTLNIEEFNAVFATLNLDVEYENEGLSWLKPSHIGYAVAEPTVDPTEENCVFAVLCLIDGETPPANISYQVSDSAIPDGAVAAFLISPDKFIEHMIKPALAHMFKDIAPADADIYFEIDNDGRRIENIKQVRLPDTKFPWGQLGKVESTKNPTLQPHKFSIEVDGTQLVINAEEMHFDWGVDQWVDLFHECRSQLELHDGTKMLTLTTENQTGHGVVEAGWWRVTGEAVLMVVSALVGAFAGKTVKVAEAAAGGATTAAEVAGEETEAAENAVATELAASLANEAGAASGIGARFRGWLTTGLASVGGGTPLPIAHLIASKKFGDEMMQIDPLISAAIDDTVSWPEAVGEYALASAQLNDALQFGLVHKQ